MGGGTRRTGSRQRPSVVTVLTVLAVITLDQATKWLVVRELAGNASGGRVEIATPWLGLHYVENRGAAFGLFQGSSDVVLVLAIALVIGITIVFHRMGGISPLMPAATGLIVGGALGNIIDRIRLGYVIDFVAVGPWPKFNLADSAVTVGVVMLFIAMLFGTDGRPYPADRTHELEAGK